MDNAAPPAYTYYRVGWSAAHIALVGMLFLSIVTWFVHDGQGQRAVLNIWAGLGKIQLDIASIIPFPWEEKSKNTQTTPPRRAVSTPVAPHAPTSRRPETVGGSESGTLAMLPFAEGVSVKLLVHHKFGGASIDGLNSFWKASGVRVLLGDPPGWLSIRADAVDTYPRIESRRFPPSEYVQVFLRHRMSPSTSQPNHFFPSVLFTLASGKGVSLSWLRSAYALDYCSAPDGLDRLIIRRPDGSCAISAIQSSSLYNRVITSLILVDMRNNIITYDLGADGTVDFIESLDASPGELVDGIQVSGYGWNTGHRHELDEILIWGRAPPQIRQSSSTMTRRFSTACTAAGSRVGPLPCPFRETPSCLGEGCAVDGPRRAMALIQLFEEPGSEILAATVTAGDVVIAETTDVFVVPCSAVARRSEGPLQRGQIIYRLGDGGEESHRYWANDRIYLSPAGFEVDDVAGTCSGASEEWVRLRTMSGKSGWLLTSSDIEGGVRRWNESLEIGWCDRNGICDLEFGFHQSGSSAHATTSRPPNAPSLEPDTSPKPAALFTSIPASPPSLTQDYGPTEALSFRRSRPPGYPPQAIRRRQQGEVVLRVLVGADGRPISVVVERSSRSRLLDRAAMDAVETWLFNPGSKDGKPAQGYVLVPVSFKLTGE